MNLMFFSGRWSGAQEAYEAEESEGWEAEGEKDWDGGEQEAGEMWADEMQCSIEFGA